MNYKELMEQPNGVLFCENDLPTTPLFFKIETVEGDIMVKPLFYPDGIEVYRYGFLEMDDCTKNSFDFYVLSDRDEMKIINKLQFK